MDVKNFLVNVIALATAPSLENAPVIQLSKADLSELESHLKKEDVAVSKDEKGVLSFRVSNVNFMAIENDKSQDVGTYGLPVEPAKNKPAKLSEEDQKIADANTNTSEPLTPEQVSALPTIR